MSRQIKISLLNYGSQVSGNTSLQVLTSSKNAAFTITMYQTPSLQMFRLRRAAEGETQKTLLKITNSNVDATRNTKTKVQAQSHKVLNENFSRPM